MKSFIKQTLIAAILVVIASCAQKSRFEQADVVTYADFEKRQSLIGSDVQFDEIVLKPTRLQVFDSLLFTVNTREERTIHLFSLKSKKKIGERIPAGQGPGEMLQPRIVKVDSASIQLFDLATSTLSEYALSDFVEHQSPTPVRKIKLDIPIVSEAYPLGEQFVGAAHNPAYQLVGSDRSGRKLAEYGQYPLSDIVFSDNEKIEAYRFSFITNLDDKMLLCYNWTDLIDILGKDGQLLKRIHGPAHFISSFKEVREGNVVSSSPVKGQVRDAYFNPVSVGDDFFVLYSGKSEDEEGYSILSDQVIVFGWDGAPKQIMTLDQGIFAMTVDGKNKKIYGISNTPEFHLVEFSYN